MRSFTSCEATDMDRWFCLSLLITHLLVIESMTKAESCISQPNKVIWRKIGHTADLSCNISAHCSAEELRYEWFVFKENIHFRLDLTSNKYSHKGASLHIKSLNVSDSGIYHCAAASRGQREGCCTQHVGRGETLVVKDQAKIMVRHILLWISLVLLGIYSLVVVTLVILKKSGYSFSGSGKTSKANQNTSHKKTQFCDVLREMHSRGNLEKGKQRANRNRSQLEGASNKFHSSTDDIYQNV